AQYAAGKIGTEPALPGQSIVYTVTATGRLVEPEQFGEIVIRSTAGGGVLRLKDIARIELGALNYDTSNTLDGAQTIGMALYLQPGANALEVADLVRARMEELKAGFPEGVDYSIPFDTTRFVDASIKEVRGTIFEAALLVLAVVFLFLQTWRATLIPMIAVPVSLIGAFAGLWAVGFSINTLTLFALVLAIGIVVDDAIVVLENVERLMRENGMRPFEAALEAMHEVSGAVVAIILVLCAVFIPVAFLGGIAGQLYRQFAVTLTFAVVISGFIALTLTPALCAILMKKGDHHARIFQPFNRGFAWLTGRFLATVELLLRHRLLSLLAFAGVLAIAVGLFLRIPSSFVPSEDQGYIFGAVQLPDGATMERTRAVSSALSSIARAEPGVQNVMVINGFDLLGGGNKTNASTLFIPLKHWDERKHLPAQAIATDLARKGAALRDGMILAFNPAAIRGLGTAGGFELYLQSRANADPARLFEVTQSFMAALRANPHLTGINSFFRPTVPQLKVEVDREKAIALGVPVQDVFDALSSTMAALYVNDFNKFGRTFRVQMQADAPFRAQPEDLGAVYVRSTTTREMIPLKSLIQTSNVVGPEQLERFNGFLAARVLGSGKPGVSSGEAIRAVEEVAAKALPEGYQVAWSGQAFQEKRTGRQSAVAFGLALVMVFLILAALYERWLLPFAVVFAVPFAVMGALSFVWARGLENDIYFQIGLVVLIGLAAKNAILIVEFAQMGFLEGKSAVEAALNAARLRFRPIIMTSLAFVLGVLPLMLSTGAGAAARRSMGTGVVGGMLAATFIATVFIPLFFVVVARRRRPRHAAEPVPQGAESGSGS
ncbi:MAG TPA: efflux RND transporter permease subunit, partial [Burkholderiales bacterium]|nr:efflux RND transporter permease subunit [Burkholderiales bacterium]